jgi:hypothetical protein
VSTAQRTLGLAGILALCALIAVLLGIGGTAYEVRAARMREAALASANQDLAADQAKLRTLAQSEQAAEKKVADLRAAEVARQAAQAAAAQSASGEGPGRGSLARQKSDGQKFLAAYPQVHDLLIAVGKSQFERAYASFFKSANLTPEQISQLESGTMDTWIQSIAITPQGGIRPTVTQLPADQATAIIGAAAYQQMQDYARLLAAQNVAIQVATESGYASAPLSQDQANQLAQIVANNSPAYQSGNAVNLRAVDWNTVLTQAAGAGLSPIQAQALQNQVQRLQYQLALSQAYQTPPAAAAKPP